MPYAQKTIHVDAFNRALFAITTVWLALALPLIAVLPGVASTLLPNMHLGDSALQPGASSSIGIPAPNQSAGGSASFNWAGYAALGTFTGISGSWRVPVIAASRGISSDATWVGVGGVVSDDLIQVGTQAMVEQGGAVYRAWYEILPNAMAYVPLAVHAGDNVAVSLLQESPGLWQITIANGTTGKRFQTVVSYNSSLSSADWIEERPSLQDGSLLPLDAFQGINWKSAMAIENGESVSAQTAGALPISMLSRSGYTIAEPSVFGSDGGSFAILRINAPSYTAANASAIGAHSMYYWQWKSGGAETMVGQVR